MLQGREINSAKLNDWFQLIVAFAVLAGFVLVFQELRQNNKIASAERISGVYQGVAQIRQFMYGSARALG